MLEKNEWCFHQLEGHSSVPAFYQKLGEENLLFLLSTLGFRQNVFAEELKNGFFNLKSRTHKDLQVEKRQTVLIEEQLRWVNSTGCPKKMY